MPEEYDYNKLLKSARAQLPKHVFETKRFEIPKPMSIIVGNRTILKNFDELATTLRRDPKHLLKYMAKELASQATVEGKSAVFMGKFGMIQMGKKFNAYVETFVLCPECKKPDTKLMKEDRLAFIKCEACGARKAVPVVK
ncbi:MAG: translation initiation factor IF-2 subunit beta [Candidatus Aenigmarchaeota archaeon]|nr:translation initiation factor IF-2 subunit beta [Candidatus Aenigmarchaeota archaeon]